MKNNIKYFLDNYLKTLNNSILKSNIKNIERAAMEIKKQYLFAEMVDLLPFLIIMCVII